MTTQSLNRIPWYGGGVSSDETASEPQVFRRRKQVDPKAGTTKEPIEAGPFSDPVLNAKRNTALAEVRARGNYVLDKQVKRLDVQMAEFWIADSCTISYDGSRTAFRTTLVANSKTIPKLVEVEFEVLDEQESAELKQRLKQNGLLFKSLVGWLNRDFDDLNQALTDEGKGWSLFKVTTRVWDMQRQSKVVVDVAEQAIRHEMFAGENLKWLVTPFFKDHYLHKTTR